MVFAVTVLSGITGVLKTVYGAKGHKNELYLITVADTTLYALVIKGLASGQGTASIIAYVSGRIVGVYLGTKIEQVIALGVLKVELFTNKKDAMCDIADSLRDSGHTVNTSVLYGINGRKRYKIEITIKRKQLGRLRQYLKKRGFNDPTFVVQELVQVGGKINV